MTQQSIVKEMIKKFKRLKISVPECILTELPCPISRIELTINYDHCEILTPPLSNLITSIFRNIFNIYNIYNHC